MNKKEEFGSKQLSTISESETLAMAKKVREMIAEGKKIYSFTLGEPDFDTPIHIKEAAIQAINNGFTKYTPVAGILPLRESVAKYMNSRNIPYKSENIVISTGAKQSLMNTVMSLVNPGDEVIIPKPYWVSYIAMVQLAGGTPVFIDTDVSQNFKMTPQQLQNAITPKTKLIIYSNPSNPSGMIYSEAELVNLIEVLDKNPHVFVISDEIYDLISFETKPRSLASFPEMFERTITINGVSKAFAMTGWRVGFTGAPKWIAELCEKYQGQVTSGTCSIAQHAANHAVKCDLEPSYKMVETFHKRRDLGMKIFKELMPNIKLPTPDGAFYFYPDISYYLNKKSTSGKIAQTVDNLVDMLLDEAGVATIAGTAFGSPTNIRLSYACSDENIINGLTAMATYLNSLS